MKDLQTPDKPTNPPEKNDFFPTWNWGPILNSQETNKICPLTYLNRIQSGYVTTLFFEYCDQPDLLRNNNSAISFAVYRVYLSECTGIYIARVPTICTYRSRTETFRLSIRLKKWASPYISECHLWTGRYRERNDENLQISLCLCHLVEDELLQVVELTRPLVQGAVAGWSFRGPVQLQHSLHLNQNIA